MIRICKECNKEFETNRSNQIICSDECREKIKQRKFVEWNNRVEKVNNDGGRIFKCKVCGKEHRLKLIQNGNHKWQLEAGWHKYCSKECRNKVIPEKRKIYNLNKKYRTFDDMFQDSFTLYSEKLNKIMEQELIMIERQFHERLKILDKRCSSLLNEHLGMFSKEMKSNMTIPEQKLMGLIRENNFPFEYTGNKTFFIGGLNPDFIHNNGSKKAIEVFGDYWHKPEEIELRTQIFKEHGYKLLILWEHEILDMNNTHNILKSIKKFMVN